MNYKGKWYVRGWFVGLGFILGILLSISIGLAYIVSL